ncbi:hypothetical protein ACI782_06775 [Geodermatophilus sp. SYSU D00703]
MTARYPWPQFRRPMDLTVAGVRFDGVSADVVDDALQRVHLDGVEADWELLEIDVELAPAEPRPSDLAHVTCHAYVMLSSGTTNSRIPAVLRPQATDQWQGLLRARRAELGGVMTLQACVTAPDADDRPLLRGSSSPWSVVLEKGTPPAAATRTPVTTRWVDFGAVDAPLLCRTYSSAPYAVALEGSTPVLYLNSGQKHFQKLLLNEYAKEERRRLRDTFSTIIAASVTRTLVQAAFDELVTNSAGNEEAVPPEDPVLRQACGAVADVMRSVSDVQDLYTRVHQAQGSLADLRAVWSEVELAIGELVSLNKNIVDFAEEVR